MCPFRQTRPQGPGVVESKFVSKVVHFELSPFSEMHQHRFLKECSSIHVNYPTSTNDYVEQEKWRN